MCDLVAGSVTFTGPVAALHELHRGWDNLRTVRSMYLEPPRVESFRRLDTEHGFDGRAPAVGRVHHKWGRGAPVAERLQVEMVIHRIPVMVEP